MALDQDRVAGAAAALGFPLTGSDGLVFSEALEHLDRTLSAAARGDVAPSFCGDLDAPEDPQAAPNASLFVESYNRKPTRHGPLTGRTAGVKDNIAVAGVPMTLGLPFLAGVVPGRSATAVSRLRASGATIVGTLLMDPLGVGGEGLGMGDLETAIRPNPWHPNHVPGGSSSGPAAAVALGQIDLALAADQGGSLRLPAAWCGVVGLKPTHGAVPTQGAIGLEPTVDHVGPIARTVQDSALAYWSLRTGRRDASRPAQLRVEASPLADLRVGLLVEGFEHLGADLGVIEMVENAARQLKDAGATLIRVSNPLHFGCGQLLQCLTAAGMWQMLQSADEVARRGYANRALAEKLLRQLGTRPDLLPSRVKMILIFGSLAGDALSYYYDLAMSQIAGHRSEYDRLFEVVDCLLMPTVSVPPPMHHANVHPRIRLLRTLTRAHLGPFNVNTAPFNVTGHPAITIPVGLSSGLPVGLSIVAPRNGEELLLWVGSTLEELVSWKGLVPN